MSGKRNNLTAGFQRQLSQPVSFPLSSRFNRRAAVVYGRLVSGRSPAKTHKWQKTRKIGSWQCVLDVYGGSPLLLAWLLRVGWKSKTDGLFLSTGRIRVRVDDEYGEVWRSESRGLKESQHLISLTFKQIAVATKNFQTCIGKGGYGRVYKGELLIAGKHMLVAVKRLNDNLRQGLKEFLTEIQLLTGQVHPHIISLLGYCHEEKEKIIVYEYAERGSLDRYIRPSDTPYSLTWLKRLEICVGAARGLDPLHSHVGKHQSIIHRDVKRANILLDEKWVAKVSDLGLSKLSFVGFDRSAVISHACGTPGYCEPEYIISGIVTKKSDVYSFGMVLFEVLCGRLCTVKEDDGLFLSAKLVKEYYKKSKLEEIVHPSLRNQMSSFSMNKFSAIAYGCLHDDREQRPPMDVVKKELEETLKMELSQSDHLAIEAAPTVKQPVVIQPIVVPVLEVDEFKKTNAIEVAPPDTKPIVIHSIGVPALPMNELKEITDNLGVKSQIGEGLFGKVLVS
ncbi:hypothetical protein R6Q57_003507 [Mikania cordata]